MQLHYRVVLASVLLVLVAGISACSTQKKRRRINLQQQVQNDNDLGRYLRSRLEPRLKFHLDKKTDLFLNDVANKLIKNAKNINTEEVVAVLIDATAGKNRNFGLPGVRLYLSRELLAKMEYESQLAALMAFHLAHIERRSLVLWLESKGLTPKNLRIGSGTSKKAANEILSKNFPEEARPNKGLKPTPRQRAFGALRYTVEDNVDAIHRSAEILYRSGYDVRGIMELWRLHQEQSAASPYSKEELAGYVKAARKSSVKVAPLRNPIVRTARFLEIRRRLRNM